MEEFIEELKYNQNINLEKGLENRIDIDYVIERLEDIEQDLILKILKQKSMEKLIEAKVEE